MSLISDLLRSKLKKAEEKSKNAEKPQINVVIGHYCGYLQKLVLKHHNSSLHTKKIIKKNKIKRKIVKKCQRERFQNREKILFYRFFPPENRFRFHITLDLFRM